MDAKTKFLIHEFSLKKTTGKTYLPVLYAFVLIKCVYFQHIY